MKNSFIKTVIVFCSFLIVAQSAQAFKGAAQSVLVPYYGEEFYQDLKSGVSNDDLVERLKTVLRSYHLRQGAGPDEITRDCTGQRGCYAHVSLGYDRARLFLMGGFYLVKKDNGYAVREVYCDREYGPSDFGRRQQPAPNQIPDNTVVNTEHTWPQSRFSNRHGKDVQKSDLHHLYPTDSQLNGIRGNHTFGEVVKDTAQLKCDSGARFGSDGKSRRDIFEPPQVHKGNVARALFYFSIRYDLEIDSNEEAYLRKWHREDPVDEEEIRRNEEIYKVQGNRNPFIDFPDLTDRISNF